MNVDNCVKILVSSYLVEYKELFDLATQFILKHKGEFVENDAWKEMQEKNPTLALKMAKDALFKL